MGATTSQIRELIRDVPQIIYVSPWKVPATNPRVQTGLVSPRLAGA